MKLVTLPLRSEAVPTYTSGYSEKLETDVLLIGEASYMTFVANPIWCKVGVTLIITF